MEKAILVARRHLKFRAPNVGGRSKMAIDLETKTNKNEKIGRQMMMMRRFFIICKGFDNDKKRRDGKK
jgi:hypothetical protein